MRLFLVETTTEADYDEFAEAVVYARDEADAIEVVRETIASEARYEAPGVWWEVGRGVTLKATPVTRKRGPVLGYGVAG